MGYPFQRRKIATAAARLLHSTSFLNQAAFHADSPTASRSRGKLHFEQLEPRILLSADPWSVALAAAISADELTASGTYTLDIVEDNGDRFFRIVDDTDADKFIQNEVDATSTIQISGRNDAADTLTLDIASLFNLSIGDFDASVDTFGITFDGAHGEDHLTFDGGSFDSVINSADGEDIGTLALVPGTDNPIDSVNYSGLELIELNSLIDVLRHKATDDGHEIAIGNATTAGQSEITANSFVNLAFATPDKAFIVNAGEGDDTITLNALDNSFDTDDTALILEFGNDWGEDEIVFDGFDGVVTLDFSAHDEDVVSAELDSHDTLTIISGGDFENFDNSLIIQNVKEGDGIARLAIVGAEFEPDLDEAGDAIAEAIEALRGQVGGVIDDLTGVIQGSIDGAETLGAFLPLIEQFDDLAGTEVGANLGQALLVVEMLEELKDRIAGFGEHVDETITDFTDLAPEQVDNLRAGGPVSLQLADLLLLDETIDPPDPVAGVAEFGALMVSVGAVRLVPQRNGDDEVDQLTVALKEFEATNKSEFTFDLGGEATLFGLRMHGEVPDIELAGKITAEALSLVISGLANGGSPDVSLGDFEIDLEAELSSAPFSAGISFGFLDAGFDNAEIDATFSAKVTNDDGSFDIESVDKEFDLNLPFEIDLGHFANVLEFAEGFDLKDALEGNILQGVVSIGSSDIFEGEPLDIALKARDDVTADLEEAFTELLTRFNLTSPSDVFGMLEQLKSFLEQVSVSDLLTAQIPFTGKRLGEFLPFAESLENVVLGELFEVIEGDREFLYTGAQSLVQQLIDEVDAQFGFDISLDFAMPELPDLPPELLFEISWSQSFDTGGLPLAFDFDIGDLGNISVRSPNGNGEPPEIGVTMDLAFDFVFGIELGPGEEINLGFPLFTPQPSDALLETGKLPEDATFSFNLFDRERLEPVNDEPQFDLHKLTAEPFEITVAASDTTDNIAPGPIVLRSVATGSDDDRLIDANVDFSELLQGANFGSSDPDQVFVRIISGTGAGQLRLIDGIEDTTTLNMAAEWSTNPDGSSRYEIVTGQRVLRGEISESSFDSGDDVSTITDTSTNFGNRLNTNGIYWLEILEGDEAGERHEILGWSGNDLTIDGDLTPDADSRYRIYLGDPTKTLVHDIQRAVDGEIADATGSSPLGSDLRPGDVVVDWTGTRFTLEAPATRIQTTDQDTGIVTTQLVDRILSMTGFDETARDELGLVSSPLSFDGQLSHEAEFIVQIDGTDYTVTLDASGTAGNNDIDALITQLNNALDDAITDAGDDPETIDVEFFRQSLNGFADGNIIGLRGEGVTSLEMRLPDGADSDPTTSDNGAVTDLGLTEPVNGRSLASEFFIRGPENGNGGFDSAGFSADMALTVDELVFGATLGFLGVEAELVEEGSITASFNLNVVDPATGGGRVLVQDLWRELSAGRFLHDSSENTGFVAPSLSFEDQFDFTARAAGLPESMLDAIETFLGDEALEVDFGVSFRLSETEPEPSFEDGTFVHAIDLSRVSALDLGYFVVEAELDSQLLDDIANLQELFQSFRNLSFAEIIGLINDAIEFVSDLEGVLGDVAGDLLDFELPLVNQRIGDLLDVTEDFAFYLEEILADPSASVQELEDRLREGLGLAAREIVEDAEGRLVGVIPEGDERPGFDLQLTFDPGNSPDPALRFDIQFGFGFDETLPIDLDIIELLELAGITDIPGDFTLTELLGLSGSGGLTLSGGGALNLALGLPLISNPSAVTDPTDLEPFFYIGEEGTRLDFDMSLSGNDLNFEARVATLGVFVRDGEGSLTADFGLFIDDDGHDTGDRLRTSQLFNGIDLGDMLTPSFGGEAELTLPLYFPTENRHLFDLEVEVPSLAKLANELAGLGLDLEDPELADEDLITISPDDILSRFTFEPPSLLDLLLDPSIVIDGLETGLDLIEDAFRGQILGIDLPLIGDALVPAANFIEDFRADFLTPVANQIMAGLEQYESTAHGLQDLLFRVFGPENEVELISAFGKEFGGLGLLTGSGLGAIRVSGSTFDTEDTNGVLPDLSDLLTEDEFVQFEWTFGDTLVDIDLPTGFDIGIPGLGLALNADVNLEVTWELNFGFGIDATEGFYLVTYDDDQDTDTLTFDATASLKGTGGGGDSTIEGTLGFLKLRADDHQDTADTDPTSLTAGFTFNLTDPKDAQNNRIAFGDLISRSTRLTDIASAELSGAAHVGLAATVDFSGLDDLNVPLPVSVLPAVDFDFILDWNITTGDLLGNGGIITGAPDVHLNNIELNLGSFISEFAGPILDVFDEILGPLEWLIGPDGLLNKRIPILSDLAGTTITLKTLAETFDQDARITPFLEMAEQIFGLIRIVGDARAEAEQDGGLVLAFGDIHLNELFDTDLRQISDLGAFNPDNLNDLISDAGDPLDNLNFNGNQQNARQFTNTLTKGDPAFHFPILSPDAVFSLLLGEDVDLVQIDVPELAFSFEYLQQFPVFGPLVATLRGAFAATLDLAIGYDTFGISNFQASGNALDILDGFYFSPVDFETGERKPAITLRGEIAAGAALSMGVAKAGVEGGIAATIFFDWNDPNKDDKVRLKEMMGNFDANFPNLGPAAIISVFDVTGLIEWFFRAFVEVKLGFFKFSKSMDLGGGVIAEFEIPFERQGVLASQSGDTLTLNIGPNAHSRIQGNIEDGDEQIFVKSTGPNSVAVWSPQFNVSASSAQEFHGVSKIIAHGGKGRDLIDMSELDHEDLDIIVDIDGGSGSDHIILGKGVEVDGELGIIRGGSGNDSIEVLAGEVRVEGGTGFNTINGVSQGGSIDAGTGGKVTIAGGGGNEQEHIIAGDGNNVLDLSDAGAGSVHRVLFGETIGANNQVFGSANGTTILDFSEVRTTNIDFVLEQVDGQVRIVATYGDNNRVVIDDNVDLIIGGRGGDQFHIHATPESGIELDGGRGADQFFVYASDDPEDAPTIDVRLRDTGTDAWNQDELYIIGTDGADNITVRETDDDYRVELGPNQSVSFFNKDGFVEDGELVTQLTVRHDVEAIPEDQLPAGIAKLIIEGRDGDDVITIEGTPAQMGVLIEGNGGDDTVVVGSAVFNEWTELGAATDGNLDFIHADSTLGGFRIVGGEGVNTLIVDDSANENDKNEHGASDDRGILQRDPVEVGWMQIAGLNMGTDLQFVEFDNVEVRLGEGDDRFDIVETIYLEDETLGDEVIANLRVFGGDGGDLLNLYSAEEGTSVALFGDYVTANSPGSGDIINVFATDGPVSVQGGPGDDAINIHSIDAETVALGGDGDDRFHVGVVIDPVTGFLIDRSTSGLLIPESGGFILNPEIFEVGSDFREDDLVLIDPRTGEIVTGEDTGDEGRPVRNFAEAVEVLDENEEPTGDFVVLSPNRINAELTLDGQEGGDLYQIWLAGEGHALINVIDTGENTGADQLELFGTRDDNVFLLRAGVNPVDMVVGNNLVGETAINERLAFVALFNEGSEDSTLDDIERVNYTQGINGDLIVRGVGGANEFYADDNLATTQLVGGTDSSLFQIGQLYNSPRLDNMFGALEPVVEADKFRTYETTRGWLSPGVSFALTAYGSPQAPNEFVVFQNDATINLIGGNQNDNFTVRSFALVSGIVPGRELIDITTGAGENLVEYVVGAPINIDGGGGFNTLRVIGTEFGDDYVITEDGIFGAGRTVNFVNIQQMEVDGAEGDDRFFILGTGPETSTIVTGGLGSDVFFIGGETPPIVSNDLKGHSGLISHNVTSSLPESLWNVVKANGISANVADNDEFGIVLTQPEGETVVVSGVENDSFDTYQIVLTQAPTAGATVRVTITAPRVAVTQVFEGPDGEPEVEVEDRDLLFVGHSYATATTTSLVLEFNETNWSTPQTVFLRAADDADVDGIRSGFLNHSVAGESVSGTTEVALRTSDGPADRMVANLADLLGQSESLTGAGDLEGLVVVIESGPGQGESRVITEAEKDGDDVILTVDRVWAIDPLSDGSDELSNFRIDISNGLALPSVLTKIYNSDVGVAFAERDGGLEVIEQTGGVDFNRDQPFVDSYEVVLTRAPDVGETVTVDIASEDGLVFADENGEPIIDGLTFDSENWDTPQIVQVAIAADEEPQKQRILEITHSVSSSETESDFDGPVESRFVRVIDADTPNVVITEKGGSTNVIEGGGLNEDALDENVDLAADLTSAPFVDSYTVAMSQAPAEGETVTVTVRADESRTSRGGYIQFGQQLKLALDPSHEPADKLTIEFTADNWDQPVTVYVQAIDDDVVNGMDTKEFATRADDLSNIQGPLLIQGGGGQGSLVGIPDPVILPNETNEWIPLGEILQDAADVFTATINKGQAEQFLRTYGYAEPIGDGDFEYDFDDLVGLTFRMLEGANGELFDMIVTGDPDEEGVTFFDLETESHLADLLAKDESELEDLRLLFNPANPLHQQLIPFREISGVEVDGDQVTLTFPVGLLESVAEGDDYTLINTNPDTFFVVEEDQVDTVFISDADAFTDETGRLMFHPPLAEENDGENGDDGPPTIEEQLAARGQLTGFGIQTGRSFDTAGDGLFDFDLPGGILFDEIEMLDLRLGSGDNHLVVESTHQGATRIDMGRGDDTVDIWSLAGPTIVNGAQGNDVINVGNPTGDGHSLLDIAAHLTVAGDVADILVEPTVVGVPAEGSNPGSNAQQRVTLTADGGEFVLRYRGPIDDPEADAPLGERTEAIPYGADADEIRDALLDAVAAFHNGDPNFANADIEVARFGDVIEVTFIGDLARTPIHVMAADPTGLEADGASTLNVLGTEDVGDVWALLTQTSLTGLGMPVFNAIQTIYVDDPQPGDELRTFTLEVGENETAELDRDASAADMQAALEGLYGEGNVAVSKVDKVYVVRFQGDLTNRVLGEDFSGLSGNEDFVHIATRETGIAPVPDLQFGQDDSARNDIQVLTIDAEGGHFSLTLDRDGTQVTTQDIPYDATAREMREALQRALGERFKLDIDVQRFGNVYHILFQGELRRVMDGEGVGFLVADSSELAGTVDLATRMDGINYYGINELNIAFGPAADNPGGHVLNVQGTSAADTNINLNDGDDRIFISSDADLDHNNLFPAGAEFGFDFLTGNLDLISGDLNIDVGEGRHQLMISDEATELAKGTDEDPVRIQRTTAGFADNHDILDHIEIEIENWTGGAIRYGAAQDANFFDGITMWGGAHGNVFEVDATHLRAEDDFSTLTTLNSGIGNDAVFISLHAEDDGPFVLNAQEGDDWVDARGSTLPLILIGHDGDDVIFGGDGGDIIFGDRARIIHYDGVTETTVIGHGGRYDFTDGRLDLPNVIRSIIHEPDDIVLEGGRDIIVGGDGDDVIFGGSGSDVIDGGAGRDLIFGDNAELDRRDTQGDFVNPRFRALTGNEIYDTGLEAAGDLLIDRDNHYADPDWGENPPVWGDLVITVHDGLTVPVGQDATATQGDNYIAGGADGDMIFGQRGENTIQGSGSIFWDVWQGHGDPLREHLGGWVPIDGLDPNDPNRSDFDRHDFDLLTLLTERPNEPIQLPRSFESATDGDDYIEGGARTDVIFGNLGQNDIIGGSSNLFGLTEAWQRYSSGANMIFGGAGTRIDRNDPGYDESEEGLVSFEDRHARNASVILGDNGNIFRLVGTGGEDSGENLTFNYDAADETRGELRVKARGVDLLDYLRWELAQANGIEVPEHLGFNDVIGEGDLIRGESGDDVIFGMGGDNVIFGDAGDDLIVGGFGNNWISGGTGDDGILGDDGLIFISRNGHTEPLYGITEARQQQDIATPGGQFNARLHIEGETNHNARLFGFAYETGGNDIIYGGLGNDSIHAGAGDDAVSGAEALPGYFTGELNEILKVTQSPDGEDLAHEAWFYNVAPYNPGDILQASDEEGQWFRLYNPTDPLRLMLVDAEGNLATEADFHYADGAPLPDDEDLFNFDLSQGVWTVPGGDPNDEGDRLYDFFLNFDPTEGERDTRFPEDLDRVEGGIPVSGNDVIFGNLGNNWIFGGNGRDHIWGGWGDSVLNANANHHSTLFSDDPLANDVEDPYQAWASIVFGGAGRDVLIANTGADRMIDWSGEFNRYVVPFNPNGGLHFWRLAPQPHVLDFLLTLSKADGADQLLGIERGGDPARNGEPMGEIALVTREDDAWQDQKGGPAKPFPQMYHGQRELMWRALPGEFGGSGGGGGGQGGGGQGGGQQQQSTNANGHTNGNNGNGSGGSQINGNGHATGDDNSADDGVALFFDASSGTFQEGETGGDGALIQSKSSQETNGDWLVEDPDMYEIFGDDEEDEAYSFVLLNDDDEETEPQRGAPNASRDARPANV